MRDSSDMMKSLLPDPAIDSSPWFQLMHDDPEEWQSVCKRAEYSYSIFDDCKDVPSTAPAAARPHVCQICSDATSASFPRPSTLESELRGLSPRPAP